MNQVLAAKNPDLEITPTDYGEGRWGAEGHTALVTGLPSWSHGAAMLSYTVSATVFDNF
jgi:hypothetical protein